MFGNHDDLNTFYGGQQSFKWIYQVFSSLIALKTKIYHEFTKLWCFLLVLRSRKKEIFLLVRELGKVIRMQIKGVDVGFCHLVFDWFYLH